MDFTRGYNSHDVDGFVRGIGGMGTLFARQPMLNAQAGMLQQRRALYEQQTEVNRQRAMMLEAQRAKAAQATAEAQEEGQSSAKLAAALGLVVKNPNDTNAIADVFSETGKSLRRHPEDTAKALGTMFHVFASMR